MNFSILIPSFNDFRIIETIKSIQNQTISKEKVQIVIFDSKSEEDLIKKIRLMLGSKDKLVIEEDDGIFDGINKGIQHCDNELIFTIGSDDKLASDSILEKIQNEFIAGDYDYLCTSTAYTDENWNRKRIWKATKPTFINFLLGRQTSHFSFTANQRIYDEIGYFDTKRYVSADFDFFLRMHGKNFKGKSLNEIATLMRIGGNSSKNLINILKGNIQIFSVAFHHYKILAFIHFSFKPFWKLREFFLAKIS